MTRDSDFKSLVRSRMTETGESYATARANLIGRSGPPAEAEALFPGVTRIGGQQDDLSAARNFCAAHGASGPGGDLTEAMALGLCGGVGFMLGVFEWRSGPTVTITCRAASMPDPFLSPLFASVGLEVEAVTATTSARAAAQLQAEVSARRPVLVTVAVGALPYRGLPHDEAAMSPHVVGVIGESGDQLLLDDRSPRPMLVDRSAADAAREPYRAARRRMIRATGDAAAVEWEALLPTAVRRAAAAYETPPVPQYASNIGQRGLSSFAEALEGAGRRPWPSLFSEGARAAVALSRVYECIHHAYTAPQAGRPLMAEFLREAAGVCDVAEWSEAAHLFHAAGGEWAAIADIARGADPALERFALALEEYGDGLDEGATPAEMASRHTRAQEAVSQCDISSTTAVDAYAAMAARVRAAADLEARALRLMSA